MQKTHLVLKEISWNLGQIADALKEINKNPNKENECTQCGLKNKLDELYWICKCGSANKFRGGGDGTHN